MADSAIGGLFGLIGQGQQYRNQRKLNEQQQKHALAQMAQSQEYNLANMATQNQYQIDAENRANAYNDVGAQIDRARKAGVSPLAALGSSGAGGLQAVSSAPSSSTPSSAGASSGGATGAGSIQSHMAQNILQAKAIDAQANLQNAQAQGQNIDNEIRNLTKSAEIGRAELINKGIKIENNQKQFDYELSRISAPIGVQAQIQAIQKASVEMFTMYTKCQNETALANSQIALDASNIRLNAQKGGLVTAQTALTQEQTISEGLSQLLTLAETDRIKALTDLTGQQTIAQQINNDIEDFRNKFEKTHKEKDWKRKRSNETINAISGAVRDVGIGLSSVAKAACEVAGTVMTGGAGPAVKSVLPNLYGSDGKVVSQILY